MSKALETSSRNSRFSTTYFTIFDKSTEDVCDRLIVVNPFNWIIYYYIDTIYLLNVSNDTCNNNETPAVIVDLESSGKNSSTYAFPSYCLRWNLIDLLTLYQASAIVKRVPYDIKDLQSTPHSFTVIDALNFLFTRYIGNTPVRD